MTRALTILNDLPALEEVHREITAFCDAEGISTEIAEEMFLVAEELLTNTMLHGYEDERRHQIEIGIEFEGGTLRLRFVDDGVPFNPLEAEEPDLDAPVEERGIGGLGIHLVKALTDRVTYTRVDEKNRLVVERTLRR